MSELCGLMVPLSTHVASIYRFITNPKYTLSMKTSSRSLIVAATVVTAFSCAVQAATVHSSVFSGLSSGAISTTGTADWGYVSVNGNTTGGLTGLFDGNSVYTNQAYGTLDDGGSILTKVSSSSSIGAVTVTENTSGISGSNNASGLTFGGNAAYGSFRNFGATTDAFTINFNDLGVGTFDITLYLGHTSATRDFTINYDLTDAGGNVSNSTASGAISGLSSSVVFGSAGSTFAYTISVTTTDASADLALNLVSTAGGSGSGLFAGYSVVAIPEPSSYALIGGLLALGAIMLRRRR
jgi:hypothetical protein